MLRAMPRKTAPTKATGGGGYTFADKVAAAHLAYMLKGAYPFGQESGRIAEVHFETRDTGAILDDLLLIMDRSPEPGKCAISVKSGRALTERGFSGEFSRDAWAQWRAASFNPDTDFLGLVVGNVGSRALEQWNRLQEEAASAPGERLVARLETDRQLSGIQRAIFASLLASSQEEAKDPIETARMVSRIRVAHFSDEREAAAVALCSEIVRDGSQTEGGKLWSRLLELVADGRARGGYFDLPRLLRALRSVVELKGHPDFEADWLRLDAVTFDNVKGVRTIIGNGVTLARAGCRDSLANAATAHPVIVLVGESGSGKSAAVAQFVAAGQFFSRTLWLSAQQLSRPGQTEVRLALGLRHTIPELIKHSSQARCALVLDGFEQFEGDARRRAVELTTALHDEAFSGWTLIVTCQTRSFEHVIDAISRAGVTNPHRVDIELPAVEEILPAVQHLPAIQILLLRTDLQPVLRNLVVLDWVVRTDVGGRLTTTRGWIGETELLAAIWDRLVGDTAMRLARDSLLRTLARLEGYKLSGAVHLDNLTADQLPLLGALQQEGLLRVIEPSVQFSHDLIGDWARFRVLDFAGRGVVEMIADQADVPRWSRAIRLYAQSLAEKGIGLESWKNTVGQLVGDDPKLQLARDLFLDGLLFATNSAHLLEEIWTDLVTDDGQILRRLLKRLLHVASLPDLRFQVLAGEGDDREQLAAWFRIPIPLYWFPALRVLDHHAHDVAINALRDGAEVCALWLRTTPAAMSGRVEAARLAVQLAKEAQAQLAEGAFFTDKVQVIFEALFLAAPELPDEVAQIALELAGRRPEPAHAVKRRQEAKLREAKLYAEWRKKNPEHARRRENNIPIGIPRFKGSMRPPAADGPLRAVPEAFQSAVLNTLALQILVPLRPDAAREILLAVCIEEPQRTDPYNDQPFLHDRCGLAHWQSGYPALYVKGPFLRLLQQQPAQGLDTIVRLVNYVTSRWLETAAGPNADEAHRRKFGLEFSRQDRTVFWIGNCNVFGWHRSGTIDAAAAECALMALEKWLYDELDAGRSITSWIEHIFNHGQSLAFAGVLVAVGLRHPGLFTTDLQPLLGNYSIYRCQLNWALNEQGEMWAIGFSGLDRRLLQVAAEWNRLPHRRSALQEVAPWLMLQHEGTQEYLSACRVEWSKRLDDPDVDRDTLQLFLARFDPASYKKTPQPDGRILIEMRLPADLESRIHAFQKDSEIQLLSLSLAGRSRRLLRDLESLQPADIAAFASDIQRLSDWHPTDLDKSEQQYRANSIAGGIAVLVIKHRQWLSDNPTIEHWCLETVRTLSPTCGDDHDSPMSAMEHTAESFLGEIGVALLIERSDDWVLRLALNGVTGFYYNATWQAMWLAYALRAKLRKRFDELINVVVLWSALRRAARREAGHFDDGDVLNKYRTALFRRYAAGELKGPLIPLRRAENLGRRLAERISRRSMSEEQRRVAAAQQEWAREHRDDRKLPRGMFEVDVEVLQRGFGFLPAMMREPIPDDTERLAGYMRELFDLEMRTLPSPSPDADHCEIDGTPFHFDAWLMQQLAEFTAHAESLDTARAFYRPILALGPAARYWVETFLQNWIRVGLAVAADQSAFVCTWQDMVEYATSLPSWRPRGPGFWCPAEYLSISLMGLHKVSVGVLGSAKHKPVVQAMRSTFDHWAGIWLKFASNAACFAHFLSTDSGRLLLPLGVRHLSGVVGSYADRDWHQHELGLLLASVVALCWAHLRHEVETQPDLRTAFLTVLTTLCARQIPEALHLRTRVSAILGTP
jgi:hypothetical protein